VKKYVAATVAVLLAANMFTGCGSGKKEDPAATFAFVALREMKIPATNDIQAALQAFLPTNAAVTGLQISEKAVTFSINGQFAMFGFLDFPIPWTDLEIPCATSWLWTEATAEMKPHKAHLIVSYFGTDGTLLDRALLLTRLTAAAAKAFDAVGVYWGHGGVVLSARRFQDIAAKATTDKLPLLTWIDFRLQKNPDKTINVLTTGLEYFGCMEIEILNSHRSYEDIMDTVMGLATITLRGEVIKDGDTIGPDDQTKIKVRHAKSVWDRKGKVLRVAM